MQQEHLDKRHSSAYDSDEIDLFELFQTLWQEKILIIAVTVLSTCAAIFYAFTAPQQYSVSMTLKPAPLGLYGEFIAGMESANEQGITLGRNTAAQVLAQLKNDLELRTNQEKYFYGDKEILAVKVSTSQGSGINQATQVTLGLDILQAEHAAKKLQGYLDFVSELTLKELNSFVMGLGNTKTITKEMLYIIDVSANEASLVKPKKFLIIAVGVILGCMLGVFAALIRSMIRKRRLQAA